MEVSEEDNRRSSSRQEAGEEMALQKEKLVMHKGRILEKAWCKP